MFFKAHVIEDEPIAMNRALTATEKFLMEKSNNTLSDPGMCCIILSCEGNVTIMLVHIL